MTDKELNKKLRRAIGSYDNELVIDTANSCMEVAKEYAEAYLKQQVGEISDEELKKDANDDLLEMVTDAKEKLDLNLNNSYRTGFFAGSYFGKKQFKKQLLNKLK